MKEKLLLLSAFVLTLGFNSCSSDNDDIPAAPTETTTTTNTSTLLLESATSSTVSFYANDAEITNISPVSFETITTTALDPTEQAEIVSTVLPEMNGNIEQLTTDFVYYAKDGDLTFDFYVVYGVSNTQHNIGLYYYDEDGNMVKVPISIWQPQTSWNLYTTEYGWDSVNNVQLYTYTYTGIRVTVKQGYKFGFYWNGNTNNATTVYYTETSLNEVVNRTNGNGNEIGGTCQIHAGTFDYNGSTYLGLEDWTDFDYQDVVMTSPNVELPTIENPTAEDVKPDTTPTEEEEEPTDPDEEEEVTPTDPEEEEPTVPEDPVVEEVKQYGGSVEVNLALNAERESDDYIYSHLSIHVRDTTDVTITLPVPAEYTVSSDDMMIVKNHEENNYVLNEQQEVFSMVINGNTVTLTITHAESYMTISTSGINADVLKYLRTNYNDGITFEVRTYFNNVDADGNIIFDRAALQTLLNQSTISFDDAEPDVYVRANGYVTEDRELEDGSTEHYVTDEVDPWACSVIPVEASLNLRTVPTESTTSANSELWLYPLR